MGLFDRKKDVGKTGTTKNFFIGNPEAEGEGIDGDFSFSDFFEDFMGITEEISKGKFLVLGRKGSGKSAYAKYIQDYSDGSTEFYSCLLKDSDIDIESVVQKLPAEIPNKNILLFEWIILTRLIKMIIGTRQAQWSDNVRALEDFYQKNSGLVQLDKLALVNATDENSYGLNVEGLAGVLTSMFGKKSIKTYVHAPFYSFVPTLKEIVAETLKYESLADTEFIVMFDDLDVKFSLKSIDNQRKLMDLIRVARDYNTSILKGTKARILVFLRNDIAQRLEGVSSDKTKILGTYGYTINWYDHADARKDESRILLRKLINKRLSANFNKFGYRIYDNDPWNSFVRNQDRAYGKKSAFKYILDCTFYRPRDLLNIFKGIGKHEYRLPLSPNDIFNLLRSYATSNFGEITDEISVIYDRQQINAIKGVLGDIARDWSNVNYQKLTDIIRSHGLQNDVISTLVEYSLLIPYDRDSKKHYFSYREDIMLDNLERYSYTTPHCITLYFNADKVIKKKTPQQWNSR